MTDTRPTETVESAALVTDPADLTARWLGDVLDASIDTVRFEPVGTGQIASCSRIHLSGSRCPDTIIAKLPAADPAAREMLAGAYAGEVRFYAQWADGADVRVPACHHAAMNDSGSEFTLLLEDLAAHRQGDQIGGCSPSQASAAVANLARLHGPRWCDPALLRTPGLTINGTDEARILAELYAPTVELFLEIAGDQLDPTDVTTLRDVTDVLERWSLARADRFALIHGDYRLDNLMFPVDGSDDVVAVDWQTVGLGLPARDLAFFIGTAMDPDERRTHERGLVDRYHRELSRYAIGDHDAAQCWDDYRFAMIQGPLVAVFGCAYGTRTPRGDTMFATMVRRSCAAIRDLATIEMARSR